jgi:hypothetical protein
MTIFSLVRCVLAFSAICTTLQGPAAAAGVEFGSPPATAKQAWDTLVERQKIVTKYMACGNEFNFFSKVSKLDDSPGEPLPEIIGKMLWLMLPPDEPMRFPTGTQPTPGPSTPSPSEPRFRLNRYIGDAPIILVQGRRPPPDPGRLPCIGTLEMFPGDLQGLPGIAFPTDPNVEGSRALQILQTLQNRLNNAIDTEFQGKCPNVISSIERIVGGSNDPVRFRFSYMVTPECMRQQINSTLLKVKVKGQLGTDKLPCHVFWATKGDWDQTVLSLIRVFYLDRRNKEAQILLPDTVKHIQEDLLTADGPRGPTSYSIIFDCGNQEEDTGSAQVRLFRRLWRDDTLRAVAGAGLADALDRLKIPFLPDILRFLASLLAQAEKSVKEFVKAVGPDIVNISIPETENHLLMIETSRYLNNDIIIADLRRDGEDPSLFEEDQSEIKAYLMEKFQSVLKGDFEEYNSRPYSRLSLFSILNIAQFADDPKLSLAARMVFDYMTAKAAIGSSLGRRLVPYRRHMEELQKRIPVSLYDNTLAGDHYIPLLLFYNGQTQQLWRNIVLTNEFGHMIYHASAMMSPNPPILDNIVMEASIEKSRRYEQRIKHAGVEIYSGGHGWLVTAGGIQTGPANFSIAPITLPLGLQTFKNDDRGAAWPTTLMFSSAVNESLMSDFIRIEGIKITHKESVLDDGDMITFDGNLCVGPGFACGFNLELPARFSPQGACADNRGQWTFFDTDKCYPPQERPPRSFVAVFQQTCPDPTLVANQQCRNFGLFEVISFSDPALSDIEDISKFDKFIERVLQNNSGIGASRGSVLSPTDVEAHGTYTAVKQKSRGVPHKIEFDATLSEDASSRNLLAPSLSRIVSIDGNDVPSPSSGTLAGGNFINADSRGRVVIGWTTDPGGGVSQRLILDLTDTDNPVRGFE